MDYVNKPNLEKFFIVFPKKKWVQANIKLKLIREIDQEKHSLSKS